MINTVIIDEQNLFKEGFKLLLSKLNDYNFNFIEITIDNFLNQKENLEVDLIFIDLNVRQSEEIDQIKKVRKKYKNAKIIVLSMFDNTKVVREVFQIGIDAYILKSTTMDLISEGLKEVFEGNTYMTEGLRLTPLKGHKPKSEVRQNLYNGNFQNKQKLTNRENEVLSLIVMAKSNIEIGAMLFISEQTVGVHKKNIMRKLGVHNTVSLIRLAIDNNLA